ncbi:MAG: methyltransferase domain-containing protein [Acidobacteria bacterium]|nr:methyltransferase domain-containing protein [Acidobacteriota bacterium]
MNERTFSSSQAHRLDAAERKEWLPIAGVLDRLALRPGMRVADIGAGTGYFSLPIAEDVGPDGVVFAVDVQPEMLAFIEEKLKAAGASNVRCSVGEAVRTGLKEKNCDLILMSYLWHELDDVDIVLLEAQRILADGGSIAIVDWKPGVVRPPGPPLEQRIAVEQVAESLQKAGFGVRSAENMGPFGYMIVGGCGR